MAKIRVIDRNNNDFPKQKLLEISKISTAFVASEKLYKNPQNIHCFDDNVYCINEDGSAQKTRNNISHKQLMEMVKTAMECRVQVINDEKKVVAEYKLFPASIVEIPILQYAIISFTEPIHYMFIERDGECVAITPQQINFD